MSVIFSGLAQIFHQFGCRLIHTGAKMKYIIASVSCLVAVISLGPQTGMAAFFEVPDEYLVDSELSLVGETSPREKRQLSIKSEGGNNAGHISGQFQKNLFSDPKTSVDATLSASSQWKKGLPTQNAGSVLLDGNRNIFNNGKARLDASGSFQRNLNTGISPHDSGFLRLDAQKNLYRNHNTNVNANAFAQRNIGTGSRPHDSFGAGLEVSRQLAGGRHGSLDAFGGYQWNTQSKHNGNLGVKWRF